MADDHNSRFFFLPRINFYCDTAIQGRADFLKRCLERMANFLCIFCEQGPSLSLRRLQCVSV